MSIKPLPALLIALMLSGAATAQSANKPPLNLELPPSDLPAAPASAPGQAHPASASSAAASAAAQPGMYYGDTSGATSVADADRAPPCDDSTYGKPQVHGSVGAGMVAGSHVSGNYQSAQMRYNQAFGSCEHPSGHMSISVGVGRGHVDGRGWQR